MNEEKAVRIEVEWDNGRIERTEGEDAAKIWDAINGGFVFRHIHGTIYEGPKLEVVREAREP